MVAGIIIAITLLMGYSSIPQIKPEESGQSSTIQEDRSSNVAGPLTHTLVLDATLPNTIEKILVYKVVSNHYTRQDSITLAQKFNMMTTGGIKEVKEGSSIASEDGTIYAILHDSGFVEYHNTNRAHTVNPLDVPENLPSDDEAVQIATTFLKERDLLPDGAEFKKTTHGRIYQLVRNGEDIVTWEDINVWFGRKLNGYSVESTQLMLAIGGQGNVIEYFTNWRNYEPFTELPVKTPEESFEELKTRGVSVGMDTADSVSINEIYLAYHTKPGAETEYYLEPVWVFKGEVLADGKSVQSVEEFIPALTDESVKSLSL